MSRRFFALSRNGEESVRFRAAVKEHVCVKFCLAACSGLLVIVLTKEKIGRKQYGPSLPRGW